jgi:hypothetical protein
MVVRKYIPVPSVLKKYEIYPSIVSFSMFSLRLPVSPVSAFNLQFLCQKRKVASHPAGEADPAHPVNFQLFAIACLNPVFVKRKADSDSWILIPGSSSLWHTICIL